MPAPEPSSTEKRLSELYQKTETTLKANALLTLEVHNIPSNEIERFSQYLYDFISENRDTTDRQEMVVVAAAIRKLVHFIATNRFDNGKISTLLESGHKVTLPPELQLEILLSLLLAFENGQRPEKADTGLHKVIRKIADSYVDEFLVGQKPYGVIAINALLILAFLRDTQTIIKLLADESLASFKARFLRRLNVLQADMAKKQPGIDLTIPDL